MAFADGVPHGVGRAESSTTGVSEATFVERRRECLEGQLECMRKLCNSSYQARLSMVNDRAHVHIRELFGNHTRR